MYVCTYVDAKSHCLNGGVKRLLVIFDLVRFSSNVSLILKGVYLDMIKLKFILIHAYIFYIKTRFPLHKAGQK